MRIRKRIRVWYPNSENFVGYPLTVKGARGADALAVSLSLGTEENGECSPVRVEQGHYDRAGVWHRNHEIHVAARVVFAEGHEVA